MKNKIFIFIISFLFVVGLTFALLIGFLPSDTKVDTVNINEVKHTAIENIDNLNADLFKMSKYDFSIFDSENKKIFSFGKTALNDINSAVKENNVCLNLSEGYIITFNTDINSQIKKTKNLYLWVCVTSLVLFMAVTILYLIFINQRIVKPFKKLKSFAGEVSKGNFETPLMYFKYNYFGDFTESFDLLREELKKSKQNEQLLEIGKKELISKICHDIKTPIASIKAVAELSQAKQNYDAKGTQVIIDKTEQLDNLITDIVAVSVKEQRDLTINLNEYMSIEMKEILLGTDYYNKVELKGDLDNVILCYDKARLTQVFDNIISNSYKYANTDIIVSFELHKDFLEVHISDFGRLIDEEDVPHLFKKSFRGVNSSGKNGQGLGLFISKHIMTSMNGDLKYTNENGKNEFVISLMLLK